MSKQGKVYLVGAGVGELAYLTLRAKELLSQADVIVYDALVNSDLLSLAPSHSIKIFVGKRGGKISTPQSEINHLLVTHSQQGKIVVRLKSGDPLVFGRAAEEVKALKAANCQFEFVPGISSVLAAPLVAGIPLTDKDASSCFVTLSAHQPEKLNWQALALIDTLVILMGTIALPKIIAYLIEAGRSPQEKIAIIHNCSQPGQSIFLGTLTDIVKKTEGINLSPAVIVIGKVVENRLNWENPAQEENVSKDNIANLPLVGKHVLVTRAAGQSSKFSSLLKQEGAVVIEMPALEITEPSSWQDLDNAISQLDSFKWLILTSANGVNYFFERFQTKGIDIRALANTKIAVVGRKTAQTLQKYHLIPDLIPTNFVADSLVAEFPESLTNVKILFPRVETGGREVLVKEFTAQGAEVTEVAAYQSKCPQAIDPQVWQALQQNLIDIVTFASSKTVTNFWQLLQTKLNQPTDIDNLLRDTKIASIGPQTTKTCIQLLGRVDIEASEYTLEGLTKAMSQFSV